MGYNPRTGPLPPEKARGHARWPVTVITSDPGISVSQDAITLPAAAFAVIDLA